MKKKEEVGGERRGLSHPILCAFKKYRNQLFSAENSIEH